MKWMLWLNFQMTRMAGYGQVSKSRARDCHLEMETELNALKISKQALWQRAVTQPAHKAAEAPAKILYKNTVRVIYTLTGEWVTAFMRKISHYFDLSSMQNSRTNGKGTEPITFSSMELLELYHSCFSCELKINLLLERKKRVSRQRKRCNLGRGSSIMPRGKFSRGLEINFVLKKIWKWIRNWLRQENIKMPTQ